MSINETEQFNPRRSLYSCLAALLACGLAVVVQPYVPTLSRAWALAASHQPETFTELYFNTSKQSPLPSSAPVGTTRTFSFHIQNHEHGEKHYVYHVTEQVNGNIKAVVTGSTNLAAEQGIDIVVPFTISIPAAQAVITVALDQPSEHISFRSES